jgi:fumarate hydratase class II
VRIGAAQSFLGLNVFKPLIIHNVLASARLLGDAARSFAADMVNRLIRR